VSSLREPAYLHRAEQRHERVLGDAVHGGRVVRERGQRQAHLRNDSVGGGALGQLRTPTASTRSPRRSRIAPIG
jgi:hypothetical protein